LRRHRAASLARGEGTIASSPRVTPITAERWDGPASEAVTAYEFAKAKLTGVKPNLGENRKVTVKM
jgi:hypothetical protein